MNETVNARQEILELLAKGKITAAEAAQMLAQTHGAPTPPAKEPPGAEPTAVKTDIPIEDETPAAHYKAAAPNGPTWFRIRVRNMATGANKVSINLPLSVFQFGFNVARRFTSELIDVDFNDLAQKMSQGESGMLVDVQDEESNEQVQIFIS